MKETQLKVIFTKKIMLKHKLKKINKDKKIYKVK